MYSMLCGRPKPKQLLDFNGSKAIRPFFVYLTALGLRECFPIVKIEYKIRSTILSGFALWVRRFIQINQSEMDEQEFLADRRECYCFARECGKAPVKLKMDWRSATMECDYLNTFSLGQLNFTSATHSGNRLEIQSFNLTSLHLYSAKSLQLPVSLTSWIERWRKRSMDRLKGTTEVRHRYEAFSGQRVFGLHLNRLSG